MTNVNPKVKAAMTSVVTLVKSKPRKLARRAIYKALAAKFKREEVEKALDILRGRAPKSKRQLGRDGGYFLLQN